MDVSSSRCSDATLGQLRENCMRSLRRCRSRRERGPWQASRGCLTSLQQAPRLPCDSAPRLFMHERDPFTVATPNYRYGFLAAALREVLSQPPGTTLDDEQRRQLALGKAFLTDVLAGASLVAKGET